MGKLVVLTLGEGDFEQWGFPVTLRIGEEGELPSTQNTGHLPPNAELVQSYISWKVIYYGFIGVKVRKLEASISANN